MNKTLTKRQQRLVDLLKQRERFQIPTVQRDLAEALGVRRDTLNKLLARTRKLLEQRNESLPQPPRRAEFRPRLGSLPNEFMT